MKKVGIITYHRAENFGAFLQCFALQKTIEELGYRVEVIDYRQSIIEETYLIFNSKRIVGMSLKNKMGYIYYTLKNIKLRLSSKKRYAACRKKYIHISSPVYKCSDIQDKYDYIVIGSDQLWNINYTKGYDEIYWGLFVKNKSKLVGYAISGNNNSLENIDTCMLVRVLDNFDNLSLRESNLTEIIQKKTSRKIPVTLDPTLILDEKVWIELLNTQHERIKEPYVLLYGVRPYKNVPDILMRKGQQLVGKAGLKIVDISKEQYYRKYTAIEFISLIYHAKYVITSSFHGLVFSILFKKDFILIKYNDGDDNRALNLLKLLRLDNRIRDINDDLHLSSNIKYDEVFDILYRERYKSLLFLKSSLQ